MSTDKYHLDDLQGAHIQGGPMTTAANVLTILSPSGSGRTGTTDDPWKREIGELRGRLCLLQTRIQDKEKSDAEVIRVNNDELALHQAAREATTAITDEVQKEMVKLRGRMDLLDGRLNLMYRELESLISWTGFRNDETNSYRNFQEKRSLQAAKLGRPLKTGKAGVQVILVEENENGDSWEPPNVEYEDEVADSSGEDIRDNNSDLQDMKPSVTSNTNRKRRRNSPRFILPDMRDPKSSMTLASSMDDDDMDQEQCQEGMSCISPVKAVSFERNPITKKFPCLVCPKEFSNKKDAARHYRIHTGEKPYTCGACQMKFIRRDQLSQHISKKHGGKAEIVNTTATEKLTLKSVFQKSEDQEDDLDNFENDSDPDYDPLPAPAVKRGRGRPRKNPPAEEVRATTRAGPRNRKTQEIIKLSGSVPDDIYSTPKDPVTNKFHCSACAKPFGNRRDLIRHFRLHTGERPYKCTECDKSFSRQDKLAVHVRKDHTEGGDETQPKRRSQFEKTATEFPCDQCEEVFSNRRLALRHIAKHSAPTVPVKHQCPSCDSSYSKKEKLNYHIRVTHGVTENEVGEDGKEKELFECPDCKKKFAHKKYLERHIIGCKGLRPFACPECERTFTQNSTLIQHRAAVHRGLKRFLCAECGKGFYTSGNYKKHMRGHRGERPYKCQLCDRAFVGLSDLRSHEAIHRGVRSHQCPDCDLKFFRRYTLVRHRRVHTGEKPYMCDICGASFTQCGTLKKHKENHSLDQRGCDRPPRVKGTKYRVRPQPEFPVEEPVQEENVPENNLEEAECVMIPSSLNHYHLTQNPPATMFHIPLPQPFPPEQPHSHYESQPSTVDFVSFFGHGHTRHGGFN